MTHDEMLEQFVSQNLNTGDLVKIELSNGVIIEGTLSHHKAVIDGKDKDAESRVCLNPPPPSAGMVSVNITIPYYSKDIISIKKSQT